MNNTVTMTRSCNYPGCDRETGQDGNPVAYRTRRFCSLRHDIKFDHLESDAQDAERSAKL